MLRPILLIILLGLTFSIAAQQHVQFTFTHEIIENRYEGIKGDFYLLKDWSLAKLYDSKKENYSELEVNYNGHENTMEVTDGEGKYIVLRPEQAPRIVVEQNDAEVSEDLQFLDSLVFTRAPLSELPSDYYLVLFEKGDLRLLLDCDVSVSTTVQRPPGKIIETKRFINRYQLVLLEGNKATILEKKKRKLDSAFKSYGSLSKWAKNNKLKMTDYETIVRFLESL